MDVDGLGGYSDGAEGRWQRYPDRTAERGSDWDRDFEREPGRRFDERDGERRDFERSSEGREEDYRVPEPRYADAPGGRYGEPADPPALREDPLFGSVPTERTDWSAPLEPAAPPSAARSVGPRSGVKLPPAGEPEHHLTEQIDRAALRRPAATPPMPAGSPAPTVYRSRRPGLIVLLSIGTATVELLLLFVLVHSMFGNNGFAAGGMLASIFSIIGVPFTALGVYAVVTGAPAATGAHPAQSWFRAPTAYLPIGLTLLVAAALAAS